MLIGIITLVGAGISALIGAVAVNTDFGRKMENALEDAVDCIKQITSRNN